MLDWDPKGKVGPSTPLPDVVTIHTPKEEEYAPIVVETPLEIPVGIKPELDVSAQLSY